LAAASGDCCACLSTGMRLADSSCHTPSATNRYSWPPRLSGTSKCHTPSFPFRQSLKSPADTPRADDAREAAGVEFCFGVLFLVDVFFIWFRGMSFSLACATAGTRTDVLGFAARASCSPEPQDHEVRIHLHRTFSPSTLKAANTFFAGLLIAFRYEKIRANTVGNPLNPARRGFSGFAALATALGSNAGS
jgi:hypothetical protein